MSDLKKVLLENIENSEGVSVDSRFLLAVSGGLDSCVLAHLFKEAGLNFGIAHVNHCLRGEESDQDALFVEALAKHYDVPFHLHELKTLKEELEKGGNLQSLAREARYNFLLDTTFSEYSFAVTAHHADDNFETMLFALTKGKGIFNVMGIRMMVDNWLFRPMLTFSREEIKEYSEQKKVGYREDSSNSSTKYSRNYIRHKVAPLLREINPSLHKAANAMMEDTKVMDLIYKDWMDKKIEKYLVGDCVNEEEQGKIPYIKSSVKEEKIELVENIIWNICNKIFEMNLTKDQISKAARTENFGAKWQGKGLDLIYKKKGYYIKSNSQ